jgi:hypothetical protein
MILSESQRLAREMGDVPFRVGLQDMRINRRRGIQCSSVRIAAQRPTLLQVFVPAYRFQLPSPLIVLLLWKERLVDEAHVPSDSVHSDRVSPSPCLTAKNQICLRRDRKS